MLYGEKSVEDLHKYAEKLFRTSEIISNKRKRRELYTNLVNKFNMEVATAEEMITFKRDIKEFTPFEIFCVVWFLDRDSLGKFFTPGEIESLSNESFAENKAEFPIIFDGMVEITPDQWIGKITLLDLMKMKRSRLLNYDENEQRALRRVKYGNVEIFKPFVSNRSVAEIKESMRNGTYIPDPITLNMGEGAEFSFENHKLTVYSLPRGMFNLDDGYHRYLAMSQIHDFDKDFDYPMELRAVNFSNSKANNFIFQQDQKTPMKKIVSSTYDTNSVANKVISRLNEDPTSNLQGMVGRNQAKINAAVLGKLISYFYKTNQIKRDEANRETIRIKNDLQKKFNLLTEQNEAFLGEYTDQMLFVTMCVFASEVDSQKYSEIILGILGLLTPEEMGLLNVTSSGTIRRKGLNIINEKIKEWG